LWKPEAAVARGLVDRIDDFGGVIDRLIELGAAEKDENTFAQVEFGEYLESLRPNPLEEDEDYRKIAIVYVEGAIVDGTVDNGQNVGGNKIARRIRKIRKEDETYKAIVLRVNSPGGSVSGSEAILFELIRAREAGLPVVVSMGPVAASGGYWIATASDKIIAGPQTITGSIGVFGILPNIESFGSSYSLNWDRVKTNPSADIFSIARPKTDQEISIIQGYVNQTYERFISLVGEGRKLALADVENLAEGRVWTGKQAYDLGLVDDIGGLSQAITVASELADLGSDFEIEEFPKVRTPAEAIAELLEVRQNGISLGRDSFDHPILQKLSETEPILNSLNDPLGVYGILPWYRAQLGFNSWKIKL
jgi:protease-4